MKNKRIAIVTASPLLAVCLTATTHAQAIRTWVGTTADMNTAANWSPAGVPSAANGDHMRFDGSSAVTTAEFPGGTFSANPGLRDLVVAASQTAALTINNTGAVDSVFRLRNDARITVEAGAAAFSLGTGGAALFLNLNNTAGSANTFTNNSSNLATFGDRVKINASGGNNGLAVFDGSGDWLYAGASTTTGISRGMIKNGSGTLTLSGANNHTSVTTFNAGTLALANVNALQASTLDTAAAGPKQVTFTIPGINIYRLGGLAGADDLDFGENSLTVGLNNANTTYSGTLSGTGTLAKAGTGTLTLTGGFSGFEGTFNAQAGTTTFTGAGSFAGSVNLTGGTTNINVPIDGTLSMAAGAVLNGEPAVTGEITLTGGQFAVNPLTPASLSTAGDLAIYGTTSVTLAIPPADTSPFVVLRYDGELFGGGAANLQLLGGSANYRNPVFDDSTDGVITLAVGSESRTWNGGAFWDINTSPNWLGGDQKFFQLDSVLFTDTMAGTVSLMGALSPSSITVNSNLTYVFSGSAGNYLAAGSLVKTGSGALFLNSPNTFAGGITLNQGIIRSQNSQALGANGNQITINNGTTLDFFGAQNANRDYKAVITGSGVDGAGAIVNSGAGANNGLGSLVLAADATIGGTGRWDLRPITAGTGVFDLAGHTLTKKGTNIVALVDSVFVSGGKIIVNEGEIRYSRNTTGTTEGLVSLQPGTTLAFENNATGFLGWDIAIEEATVRCLGNPFTANAAATLTTAATFLAETDFTLTGAVSGDGELIKNGGASLVLVGDSSHTGGTTVNAGTLQLGAGGATGSVPGDIANYGTVAYNRSDNLSLPNEIYGTGGLLKDGAGTLTIDLQQTYGGATTVNNGTLVLDDGANTLPTTTLVTLGDAAGAVLDLNGNDQEIRGLAGGGIVGGTVVNRGDSAVTLACRPTGGDNIAFSGVIDGDIRFAVLGDKFAPSFVAPRQRLAGTANTFTGGVRVDGSTLMVREDGSLGAIPAAFEADHITLRNNGTMLNEADPPFSLHTHPNRGITLEAGGGGMVAGFNTTVTIGGVISGDNGSPLSIVPNNGTVILAADNTYEGETILMPGDLARLQIGNGGTSGTLGSGAVTNDGLLRFNRSDGTSIPNDISGTGQVVQQGSGSTTLTGTLTYAGTTTVQAGTLAGNGSSLSATTVQTGATLAPGASTGPMATAALTIQAGATLAYEINSTSLTADRLTAGGDVTLAAGALLTGSDVAAVPAAIAPGTKFVVIDYTGFALTGEFAGLSAGGTVMIGATPFMIAYADTNDGVNDGNFVTLTAGSAPAGYAGWALAKGLVEGADGDDDKDGVPNALEYVFGSEPKTPGASPLEASDDGDFFVLAFPRDDGAETPDTSLAVQYGADLAVPGAWTSVIIGATGAGIVTVEENGPAPDWITVRIPKNGQPKLFARLKVTVIP